MANKNICKFSSPLLSASLYISRFIFETDEVTMKKAVTLKENRMYLISKGNGKMRIDLKELNFQAGDLVFAFKNEKIAITETNQCEFMYIDFEGVRATELLRRFAIMDSNRRFSGFDGLIPFWKESLSRASKENIDLSAESILLYSFSRFADSAPKGNSLINKIIELTEENFRDNSFSINSVADELGYNTKYISHVFKKKNGATYSEYLRDLRIKYAISLFDHGLDSVKNVAALSGFSDPLYFSTVFKKCVGVTPKEYKKTK